MYSVRDLRILLDFHTRMKSSEKKLAYMREYSKRKRRERAEYHKMWQQTPAGIKSRRVSHWKHRGIVSDDFDAVYERYITTMNCEACGVGLTTDKQSTKTQRCLDHDHITGEVRAVLCCACNTREGVTKNTRPRRYSAV